MPEAKLKVDLEVVCPECKSVLKVQTWRKRVSDPVPAEYDENTNVITLKQGEMFDAGKQRAEKA